ncbi:MAG: DUF2778 domain-containing protein [Nitrospira sp. CR1.1]|nr:DUF2778 domain-containing protein [Nitrospira sp. CR1.1]
MLDSQLLFPARLTATSTAQPGLPTVIASTTVPVSSAVAGSTLFYHQDGLGTVTELTDSNGAVAKAYAYDAYGSILESPGTVEQPYTYTGRELDQETGLYYYRARYYDAATGRFLQKDPIGLLGGDLNLYRYSQNAPMDFIDPSGLTKLTYDVKNKRLHVDPEQQGKTPYDMSATSGSGSCMNNPRCSQRQGEGPIPPGDYTIDTNDLSNPDLFGDLKRHFRGPGFRDWGDWRVPIMPDKGTTISPRGGFFLHGGSRPGSAGCIDIGGGIMGNGLTDKLLFDLLSDPNHSVPLTVF